MRGYSYLILLSLSSGFELSSDCSSTKNYYDTSLMSCTACETNKVPSSDYLSCICTEGMIKNFQGTSSDFTCSQCASNTVPNSDQTVCQSCPGSISNNECVCDSSLYKVPYEDSLKQSGETPTSKSCLQCTQLTYPGQSANECQTCSDIEMVRSQTNYECFCNSSYFTSQNSCINSLSAEDITVTYPISEAIIVIYQKLESGSGVGQKNVTASATFEYYYMKAAYDCYMFYDIVACQQLANLCVLQLYNQKSTVCRLYREITQNGVQSKEISDYGAKENMAWIYYENSTESYLKKDRLEMLITFDPDDSEKVNVLTFQLASFYLNGTFIGFSNLTDQLILCPHSYKVGKYYRTFGTNVDVTCSLDLSVYVTSTETIFYELYLVDLNNTLVDVPVLIKDFVDTSGSKPNKNSDESNWKLVRRFFIYDNVSGKEGTNAYINGDQSSVLQYMQKASLRLTLINDQDQKIYVPVLILDYKARMTTYIENTDSTDTITFKSIYTMNTSKFWKITLGVFIGMNILVLIITATRTYIWAKNNPSAHIRHSYTSKLVIQGFWLLAGTWSFIIFWFLIGTAAYWFIFYKLQYHVYVLIPPIDTFDYNYVPFIAVFSLVFILQLVWVGYIIKSQTSCDLILIDREQPQRAFKPGVDKITAAIYRDENNYKEYVSAWRTLMVTNEYAELQAQRYVYIELTLFFLLFFLKGVYWEDLARSQPSFAVNSVGINLIPINMILRFFLTSFLFIIISYVQLVLRKVFSTWFPTPTQAFIDLCIVSNISILIFDDSLHGYYIHGVTPLNRADMALEELHDGLSEDKLKSSHKKSLLVPDEDDLFTFEIYIPFDMRIQYDNIMQMAKSDQEFNKKHENIRKSEKTRFKLNERFKAFFDPEIRNLRSFVFEKSSLQRMLSMPPTDMSTYTGSTFFYKDPAMTFERTLFLGREFSLLLMDLLVFSLMDLAVGNSLVSALTTYLFSKLLSYIRYELGERNLALKTMVDRRFII